MNIHTWATKWGITVECLRDLQITLGTFTPPLPETNATYGKSEAFVQSAVRIEASQKGMKVWRNNVGALTPKGSSRPVRYGLANDSEQMNDILKSSDLIGICPTLITPQHVGRVMGIFDATECKEPGWQFNPTDPHEAAQWAFGRVVLAAGGNFRFVTGPGQL